MCSPVKEFGAGKYRASPRSIVSPRLPRKFESTAWRGVGSKPMICSAILGTSGPETRITPTAPRPGALAMAAMVSGDATDLAALLGSLGFHHLVYSPLLCDR